MDFLLNAPTILAATHAVIVIAIALRVIMRRPDTGVALAWLLLVTILPFAGAVAYLLIGERRISHRRKRGHGPARNQERGFPLRSRQQVSDVFRHAEDAAVDRRGR